jgi:hypothetical protein
MNKQEQLFENKIALTIANDKNYVIENDQTYYEYLKANIDCNTYYLFTDDAEVEKLNNEFLEYAKAHYNYKPE